LEGLLSGFIRELSDSPIGPRIKAPQRRNFSCARTHAHARTQIYASANGQSERKMRRRERKREEAEKKTHGGGQAKETDGGGRDGSAPHPRGKGDRERERESRLGSHSRLATSKSHSEVPCTFEIFPLNELHVVADSSRRRDRTARMKTARPLDIDRVSSRSGLTGAARRSLGAHILSARANNGGTGNCGSGSERMGRGGIAGTACSANL